MGIRQAAGVPSSKFRNPAGSQFPCSEGAGDINIVPQGFVWKTDPNTWAEALEKAGRSCLPFHSSLGEHRCHSAPSPDTTVHLISPSKRRVWARLKALLSGQHKALHPRTLGEETTSKRAAGGLPQYASWNKMATT